MCVLFLDLCVCYSLTCVYINVCQGCAVGRSGEDECPSCSFCIAEQHQHHELLGDGGRMVLLGGVALSVSGGGAGVRFRGSLKTAGSTGAATGFRFRGNSELFLQSKFPLK